MRVLKKSVSLYPETLAQLDRLSKDYFHSSRFVLSAVLCEAVNTAYVSVFGADKCDLDYKLTSDDLNDLYI